MSGIPQEDLLSSGFERAVSLVCPNTEESNRCMSTVQVLAVWCACLSTWADMITKLVSTDSLGLNQKSMYEDMSLCVSKSYEDIPK